MNKIIQIAVAISIDPQSGHETHKMVCVGSDGRAYELKGNASVGSAHWVKLPELPKGEKQ